MHINRIFELSMIQDNKQFEEAFARSFCGDGDLCENDDEYVDLSMASKGLIVKYRNSTRKKKVKIIADVATVTNGDVDDAGKFIHKLEKHIDKYFDARYELEDFTVSGLTLTATLDVGNSENVSAYLKAIRRIGKVKSFSPVSYDGIDDNISFCLKGNSNAVEFLMFDLDKYMAAQMKKAGGLKKYKGILRVEARLTKQKAIQKYSAAYSTTDQIMQLLKQCQGIFTGIFTSIIPFGDFYKKREADEIIRNEISDTVLRRRMLRLLALIPEKKSLLLAQKEMAYRHQDDLMIEFAKINLSPITLSKRHEMNYLPNIYNYFT